MTCIYKKKTKNHVTLGFLCWGIRTRTRKGRTRICSVTITPYPNFLASPLKLASDFSIASAKVRSFSEFSKLFADFFFENLYFSIIIT